MRLSETRIAAIVVASLLSMAVQANPLELALQPGAEEGTVEVSLTNNGGTTLSVLRWDTPFEEILSSDVFDVERPRKGWPLAERAAYVGREVKRSVPGEDQYLVLEPGTTISQSVELNDYYRIDRADTRNVRFSGQIRYSESRAATSGMLARKALSPSALSTFATESNSVQIQVFPQLSLRVVTPAYNNCSVQQQTDIVAAAELAQEYVTTGVTDLQSLAVSERASSPRFSTWFGAYAETRFDRVVSNFEAIGNALENEEIKFDCGCDESGVYAYVYPARPYDVFLCPAFRAASVGGTDSRAGTIVHELSHFAILADTDDHVYSQRGAQSLASTDPAIAISNADNHEYFAENTPALSILGTTVTTEPDDLPVLALDTPVSGSVPLEGSVTYQVSGASQVTLSSVSGDADLYVYTDADSSAEICNSVSPSESDVCEVFAQGTVYVRVFGFTAASYVLEATADGSSTPPVASVISLTPNVGVSGALDEDERLVYEVSGAESIVLESLSGDADLYIFDSLDFTDTTLICVSAEFSNESTVDSCILPSIADTYYALIVGYTASDYSLTAVMSSVEPDEEPGTVDMGRLVVGEAVTASVASDQYHLFVVAGASAIELTSLSGDADLGVYETDDYSEAGLLCESVEASTESVVESCDIPFGADHFIAVRGYDDSSYSLLATSGPDDDDPAPEVPGTEVPGTAVPETEVPVTEVPETEVPVTEVPETEVTVTEVTVTEVPGTEGSGTEGSVTEVPVTEVPATEVPGTGAPVTEEPGTGGPGSVVPETGVPGTEEPGTDGPGTVIPVTDVPVTEVPETDEPGPGEPVTVVTGQDEPVTVEPGTEGPGTVVPETDAPVTEEPGTDGPGTVVPGTEVPGTPLAPDDSPIPVIPPVASSGGSGGGGGALDFWGLGLLILTLAYRRSAVRKS